MKKLGKSTLDELAKIIPILSEKEQRSSIGGIDIMMKVDNLLIKLALRMKFDL